MIKGLIQRYLEKSVVKYFNAHPQIKLVVVTGSVGKTSTKFAIAKVLSEKFQVRFNEGNHNSEISAPLAILGIDFPQDIRSRSEWMRVRRDIKARITADADVDVIVQELGTDRIGQIPHFAKYLKPDMAVVTGISEEHMEFFKNLDNVAKEEMAITSVSKQVLINGDDIAMHYHYLADAKLVSTYGVASSNDYYFSFDEKSNDNGYYGKVEATDIANGVPVELMVFGAHSIRPVVAAAAVGIKFGLSSEQLASGLAKVRPVPGRMNVLPGIKNIRIIDDSYNSSPLAAIAALTTLYNITSDKKVAVLGDMNELGESSSVEHQKLGDFCDPDQLKLVVTVGQLAKKFIAPAATLKGCSVKSFDNSREAGKFLVENIEEGTTVLFKGSQGGIFLEEAIKPLLSNPMLSENLVRQSAAWLKKKDDFFSGKTK